MENTHNFIMPRTNLVGFGALKDLSTKLLDYKLARAMLVTDKNLESLGYLGMVQKILKALFISYEVFTGIEHPNCTVSFVEDGLKHMESLKSLIRDYSLIISIGGGTVHDCAKAMSIVWTNGGSITDYEGYDKILKPTLRHIAINTTSGSGTEVSYTAIITDNTKRMKMVITSPKIMPFLSVNDPMFMQTMPREVTATSGIDVLAHAIEAYSATEASPITDALALGSLKLAHRSLRRAYVNGQDLEARENMMFAAMMAGMAFSNGGLGYVHAMAHQLGGFYEQNPHGSYNAALLPHVLAFNAPTIPLERLLKLAEALGIGAEDRDRAVAGISDAFRTLSNDIGLPCTLRSLGVDEDDIPAMSANALKDICALTNPRQGTAEEIAGIFRAAY